MYSVLIFTYFGPHCYAQEVEYAIFVALDQWRAFCSSWSLHSTHVYKGRAVRLLPLYEPYLPSTSSRLPSQHRHLAFLIFICQRTCFVPREEIYLQRPSPTRPIANSDHPRVTISGCHIIFAHQLYRSNSAHVVYLTYLVHLLFLTILRANLIQLDIFGFSALYILT